LGIAVDADHIGLLGPFDDCLPDFSGEGLVGIGGRGELRLDPFAGGFGLVLSVFVHIAGPIVEDLVGPFDLSKTSVALVELIAASFVKLTEILLGLLMLMDQLSYPAGWANEVQDRLVGFFAIGDLKLGGGVFKSKHVDRGRHFERRVIDEPRL
jgi:hypothetical protein